MKKNVLVTGGCGFIGAHVTKKLLDKGYSVHVVDDMSGADYEFFIDLLSDFQVRTVPVGVVRVWESQKEESETSDIVVFEGDFVEPPIIDRLAQGRYDAVVHLAAEPSVQRSIEYPVSTHNNNLQKSVELFHICAKKQIRVVFASSAAIYGNTQDLPVGEAATPSPASPYGLQKLQCEQVINMFSDIYDLSAMTLRFFNVYGPGQRGDSPYSTVIASWVNRIKENKSLRLDGDGEQTRDYIHVYDVAEACVLSLESNESKTLNIASGESKSNNEILSILSLQCNFTVDYSPARAGDIKHSLASVNMMEETLMFKPKVDIATGVRDLLKGCVNAG